LTILGTLAVALVACTAKPSTRTPSGTLRLMLDAAVDRDAARMKTHCTGIAVDQCQQLLDAIEEMETTGKASKFASHVATTGPAPSGSRSNAHADLFGVSRDLFMRVSVTLQQDDKGNWKIDQMTWESRRPE